MTEATSTRTTRKHLTDVEIAKILGLAKGELTQRNIANLMGCSQKAVQHTLASYKFETFQGRNQRRDYQRKTTVREDRYIERALKQNESLPLRDITNIIRQTVPPISRWTLARRRSEAGLGSFIAAEKPGLRPENVDARFQWALEHRNWTIEQWKRVV
jgi:predicted transcriptional regulator